MVVDAPFVYHGNEPVDLTENVAHLRMETKPMSFEPVVLPPPGAPGKNVKPATAQTAADTSKPPQERKSFLAKIGAFFSGIFH